VEVVVGVEEEAARRLNAPYLKRLATGLPYILAKWAMTLDGKTACGTGDSKWISGPRSRSLVHEVRGRMDAILVGIRTALADNPELTARPAGPRVPARVVMDPAARLPIDSKLARTAREIPVLVATTDRAPADRLDRLAGAGCDLLRFPGTGPVPVVRLLKELGMRGMTNVLVEGGGTILGAFADAGQVDGVEVFIAPVIEGGAHNFQPVRGRGVALMADALRLDRSETILLDGDVLIRGTRDAPWLGLETGHRSP
jgi:diaminohydroxyphosphoribosylaminopyrimidine deaminase/5-amino-6-(5-phosphoribosylamino)uracil reductase